MAVVFSQYRGWGVTHTWVWLTHVGESRRCVCGSHFGAGILHQSGEEGGVRPGCGACSDPDCLWNNGHGDDVEKMVKWVSITCYHDQENIWDEDDHRVTC